MYIYAFQWEVHCSTWIHCSWFGHFISLGNFDGFNLPPLSTSCLFHDLISNLVFFAHNFEENLGCIGWFLLSGCSMLSDHFHLSLVRLCVRVYLWLLLIKYTLFGKCTKRGKGSLLLFSPVRLVIQVALSLGRLSWTVDVDIDCWTRRRNLGSEVSSFTFVYCVCSVCMCNVRLQYLGFI